MKGPESVRNKSQPSRSSRFDLASHEITSTYTMSKIDRASLATSARNTSENVHELLHACINNNLGAFLSRLERAQTRSTALIRFRHGLTPLTIACRYSAVRVARWICANDSAALECKDSRGNTALHHAIATGHSRCVDALLEAGASVQSRNSEGVAPMHLAAYHGHKAIVKRLLQHKESTLDSRDSTGKTPLMLASFRGRTPVVSMLLNNRVHVNSQDKAGWTALMYAAFTGRIAICRELLEYAAARMIVEYRTGKCAADLAQEAGYYEVADILDNKEVATRTPSLLEGMYMPKLRPASRTTIDTTDASMLKTPLRTPVATKRTPAQHPTSYSQRRHRSTSPPAPQKMSQSTSAPSAVFGSPMIPYPHASSQPQAPSKQSSYAPPQQIPPPAIPAPSAQRPSPAQSSGLRRSQPKATIKPGNLAPQNASRGKPSGQAGAASQSAYHKPGVHTSAKPDTQLQQQTKHQSQKSILSLVKQQQQQQQQGGHIGHKPPLKYPPPSQHSGRLSSRPSNISGNPIQNAGSSHGTELPDGCLRRDSYVPMAVPGSFPHLQGASTSKRDSQNICSFAVPPPPPLPPHPIGAASAAAPPHKPSPLHTPITVIPDPLGITSSQRILSSGQYAAKPQSISGRIMDSISRASLKYLDSRTDQALKRESAQQRLSSRPILDTSTQPPNEVPESSRTTCLQKLARYAKIGSRRRRKTTSSAPRRTHTLQDPYKKYHDSTWIRPYWRVFSRIVTLWMPDLILNKLLKKETPEKRQAWREKIALCFIILLITGLTALISFGLSSLFCHPVDPISLHVLSEKHGANATEKLTVVRGRIYDVSNPADQLALRLSKSQYGHDSSSLFAPFPEETRQCRFWPKEMSASSCYSVFGENPGCTSSKPVLDTLRRLRTNKWVVYQWSDVLREGNPEKLFVYNEFVFSLKAYFTGTGTEGGYGEHFGKNLSQALHNIVGTDATITVSRNAALQELVPCWDSQLRLGRIEGSTVGCVITSGITLSVTVILNVMILTKLACAVLFDWAFSLQLTKIAKHFTRGNNKRVPHVLITITCYNESEETLRYTLESVAMTNYACSRKIMFVITDGQVPATGDTRTTPEIVRSMISRLSPSEPIRPLPYISIGEGPREYNAAEVVPGSYISLNGVPVPCILINKVGTKREREANVPKAGNRGKRDSQLIVLQWLRNVLMNDHLTPLEFELCRSATRLSQLNPDQFEYLLMVDADTHIDVECIPRLVAAMERDPGIMGLCGETKIANKTESWVTRIQVYEYYISHHLSKAFESLWGGVTCLPGCCSMYRIFSRKTQSGSLVPLLVAPEVIDAYSSNETNTLHQKNLLLLGEDRYLTTVLLRAFPKRKLIYVPRAVCRTTVPSKLAVLVSQRRRWINSTIHNLLELILVQDLCGTFCCSMQFLVLMDLLGNVVLPSSVIFFYYLIFAYFFGYPVAMPLLLMALTFALQGLMILITTQRIAYIYWMFIYILAMPLWNFVLPVYAFWRFDDFSWGKTRMAGKEDSVAEFITDDERQALEPIPLKRWKDWMRDHFALGSGQAQNGNGESEKPAGMAGASKGAVHRGQHMPVAKSTQAPFPSIGSMRKDGPSRKYERWYQELSKVQIPTPASHTGVAAQTAPPKQLPKPGTALTRK